MESSGAAFFGGVLFALVGGYVVRQIVKALRVESADGPAGVEISDPNLRKLYEVAARLDQFSKVAAHPGELLKHDLFEHGVDRLSGPDFSIDDLFGYADGENHMLACMAITAIARHHDGPETRQRLIRITGPMALWPVHFVLQHLAEAAPPDEAVIGPVIVELAGQLWTDQVKSKLEDLLTKRVAAGELPGFGDALKRLPEDNAYAVEEFVKGITAFDSAKMLVEFANRTSTSSADGATDTSFLRGIGQVWDDASGKNADLLIDHPTQNEQLGRMTASVVAKPAKSVLVIGDAGVGKSAAISRFARRLQSRKWTIFVAGHNELSAGQTYIGEFEAQLRRLIAMLKSQPQTLWIVPGFEALAFSGRHRYNLVSALDSLLPHIEAGEVKIVAEMTRSAYERLLQINPGIASSFTIVRLEALDDDETLALARQWLARFAPDTTPSVVNEAWHLARHFLGETAAPGNIMKLLHLTHQRLKRKAAKGKPLHITQEDLFDTLIEQTGLSPVMLDEDQVLDIDALRRHFHHCVIGQDEAVGCLVERVAMIKAGVTDPTRPAGVFLFAGPTGTGKTEIAKALTEWLFGSPRRMIRLDMSELQTPDTIDRLVGSDASEGGALTDKIREQPFSVVLLDEFEKAHPAIWDFFLQVFDDGRLTDKHGRTADFRHAIVILTSNLGAAIPTETPMGFSGTQAGFDPASVHTEIEKVFRREFVNRIDRVVVFRPLSRDVMREILQKELDLAFSRRGLRGRSWAVEWDDSAVNFLLEQGFTPDLGARPLKRAIDRHLLSPLAQTIVRRQVPEGDQFLFVTQRGNDLHVDFVDPDAPSQSLTPPDSRGDTAAKDDPGAITLRTIILQGEGKPEEVAELHGRHLALSKTISSPAWREEKQANMSLMELPEFWQSMERFDILGKVECIDRVEAAMQHAGSLLRRIGGSAKPKRGAYPAELVRTLAQSLHLIEIACQDLEHGRPLEAFVHIEAGRGAGDATAAANFAGRLADMYLAWAKQRRMHCKVLENTRPPKATDVAVTLAVSGFGAHTILAPENGLHVFESGTSKAGKAAGKTARVTTRVTVVPQPLESAPTRPDGLRERARRCVADAGTPTRNVVRRYREQPSPLVRDSARGWRTGRADRVFGGDFDLFE
jgi:ATP-dependent Clp protease ATP-binding subunit ClpC